MFSRVCELLRLPAAGLSASGAALNVYTHRWEDGLSNPLHRQQVAEIISPLVANSIGNWAGSVGFMLLTTMFAEEVRSIAIKRNNTNLEEIANSIEIFGFIGGLSLNLLAEIYKMVDWQIQLISNNSQLLPDMLFAAVALISTLVGVKGFYEHARNRQESNQDHDVNMSTS